MLGIFEHKVAKLFCSTSSSLIFKRRFVSRKKSYAMPKGGIPDRWEAYKPMGTPIKGTRFITFKVPLDQKFRVMPGDSFTPTELVEQIQAAGRKLGLVIDLTNTKRYYRNQELMNLGVKYEKIYTEGHIVPKRSVVEQFTQAVDAFTAENEDNDNLIGVHCTHGVNRTGYLVCRYMIDNLEFSPENAIAAYGEARGYPIERVNYLAALRGEHVEDSQQEKDHARERHSGSREPRHHNHISHDSHTGAQDLRNGRGGSQQTSRHFHSQSSQWRGPGNGPYSQHPNGSGYHHQYGDMNDRYGHMNDWYGHMNDRYGHMNDQYGHMNGHYGPENGQYGQRFDYYGQRNDQYNQFGQRSGHYGQRTNPYGQRNGQYGQRNPHRQGELSMSQYQDMPGQSRQYSDQYNEPDWGDGQGGSGSSWRHGQVYNGSSERHRRSGRYDYNGPPSWVLSRQ